MPTADEMDHRGDSFQVGDADLVVNGRIPRIARLCDEWLEDLDEPETLVAKMKKVAVADILTFWQRLPDTLPRYGYFMEWDNVAALAVKSYDYWWEKQISPKTRNLVRKAEKKNVYVTTVEFGDELLEGIKAIFDESPVRQGKPFWHYKKDIGQIRKEMSHRLDISHFIGAYYRNRLIGFIKLLDAKKYAMAVEIISMLEHRDKSPTNALLAKAIQICERQSIPFLVYSRWSEGSLGDFKRHNGFEKVLLPRYFVPLSPMGWIALKLHLHREMKNLIPERVRKRLIAIRKRWYTKRKNL